MQGAGDPFVFRVTPGLAIQLVVGLSLAFILLFGAGLVTGLGWAGSTDSGSRLAAAIAGIEVEAAGGTLERVVSPPAVEGVPAAASAPAAPPAESRLLPVLAAVQQRSAESPAGAGRLAAWRESFRRNTVHLGAYASEETALRVRDQLRESGFDPAVDRRRAASGTVLYHVAVDRGRLMGTAGTERQTVAPNGRSLEALAALARSAGPAGAAGDRP